MQVLRLPLVLLALTAAAAAQDTDKTLNLPATFSGKLPCADCPGIETVLTLRPDHLFFMTMNYLERSAPLNTLMGQWDTDMQSKRIELTQANGRTDKYAIFDRDTLRGRTHARPAWETDRIQASVRTEALGKRVG